MLLVHRSLQEIIMNATVEERSVWRFDILNFCFDYYFFFFFQSVMLV